MALDLSSLKKAVTSLEKAIRVTSTQTKDQINTDQEEVLRAGIIKNFEFTYEMCWKFMARWLKVNLSNSVTENMLTRKDLFRTAAENQLIDNVENWFLYTKARNETSHTYNNEIAESVYLVALKFIHDAKDLLANLEVKNQ